MCYDIIINMEIRQHKFNRKTIIIIVATVVVALLAAIGIGIALKVQNDASFQDSPQVMLQANRDDFEWQYDIAAPDIIQIVGQNIAEVSPGAPGATADYTFTFEGQSPGKTAIRFVLRDISGSPTERIYFEAEVRDDMKARIVRIDNVSEQLEQLFPPIELPEFTEETDTSSETESEEPSQDPAVETSE